MGKKSKPPPPPDYAALATQQAALSKTAANEQTVTNRPDQTTPWGSTTWTQNAGTGQWDQNVQLNEYDQALLDQNRDFQGQQQDVASGLLDRAGGTLATPMTLDGLPQAQNYDMSQLGQYGSMDPSQLSAQGQYDPSQLGEQGQYDFSQLGAQGQFDPSQLSEQGSFDFSQLPELQGMDLSGLNQLDPGFGAVESVRDAMMSRMAPARQRTRDAEIMRLKMQGIPEDSPAMQAAMQRLDEGDTDAEQQALLGAAGEYGNIFQRGLAGNAQTLQQQGAIAALRGQQRGQLFNEQGANASLMNQNRGQQFQERQFGANLANQNRGQLFGEQGANADLMSRNRGQDFLEQGAYADLANQNRGQQFGEQSATAAFQNQIRGQQFNEQGQAAQLSGMLRQQSLAEQNMLRQSPMDDFLRLTQGINPTMPNMPSFMAGTGYEAADMYGAAKDTYQAQVEQVNARNANRAGITKGLMGLGGAALGGPMFGAGGMFGK